MINIDADLESVHLASNFSPDLTLTSRVTDRLLPLQILGNKLGRRKNLYDTSHVQTRKGGN